jgi:hypothetical protein
MSRLRQNVAAAKSVRVSLTKEAAAQLEELRHLRYPDTKRGTSAIVVRAIRRLHNDTKQSKVKYARSKAERLELEEKARKYDEMIAGRSAGGKKVSAKLTPEERSERARRAVLARYAKAREDVVK